VAVVLACLAPACSGSDADSGADVDGVTGTNADTGATDAGASVDATDDAGGTDTATGDTRQVLDDPAAGTPLPAPTTTMRLRPRGATPSSPDGVPLLTPEVSYPGLVIDTAFDIAIGAGDPAAAGDTEPRIQFTTDGSLLVMDLVSLTVNAYGPDSMVRWSVPLAADVEGAAPWAMALGPEQVLYVSYRRAVDDTFVLAAIATSGERGGQLLTTWPTPWQCVESFCGEVDLAHDGVVLSGFGSDTAEVAPYVDAIGGITGVTLDVPASAEQTHQAGPAMPDDWVAMDEFGNGLWSSRTTVTLADHRWVFDVMGVRQAEGTYAFFDAQSDGSVISTFALTDDAGAPGQLVWLDLLPDGSVSAFRLPAEAQSLYDTAVVDGTRYAVARDGNRFRLMRLVASG
jgi:hypothetical protein